MLQPRKAMIPGYSSSSPKFFFGVHVLQYLRTYFSAIAVSMAFASQAVAADGTSVPEPNMIAMLSLAMAGVLIGRRMAKNTPPRD